MSARRAKRGLEPEPIEAMTPVLATGQSPILGAGESSFVPSSTTRRTPAASPIPATRDPATPVPTQNGTLLKPTCFATIELTRRRNAI
ncbi:hypothetical protein Ancab_031574 [Ancistrocladus abbreviatus]